LTPLWPASEGLAFLFLLTIVHDFALWAATFRRDSINQIRGTGVSSVLLAGFPEKSLLAAQPYFFDDASIHTTFSPELGF